MARRTGRRCLALPSNRLGLYLALRHWCRPGQRLLMSPLSADEILFLVLAAGLRPVIAPLSPRDGNIDAGAVDLDRIDAVLTTNLYGLPDRVAAFAGKILIEDVAHAIETTVGGRPLGAFGVAGVFSLSKHVGAGSGGVLAVEHEADLRALRRERDRLLRPGALHREILTILTSAVRHTALRLNLVRPALRAMRALGMEEPRDRPPHPPRLGDLVAALRTAPGLPAFDSWVRATCTTTGPGSAPCRSGTRCSGCAPYPTGAPSASRGPDAVPVAHRRPGRPRPPSPACSSGCRCLVADRNAAIAALERRGVATGYLYDPPYDGYLPGFTDPSPHPEVALWWGRHVLPVDPLHAHRAMPVLERLGSASPLLPTASSDIS